MSTKPLLFVAFLFVIALSSCSGSSSTPTPPMDAELIFGRNERAYFKKTSSTTATAVVTEGNGFPAKFYEIETGRMSAGVALDPRLVSVSLDRNVLSVKGKPGLFEYVEVKAGEMPNQPSKLLAPTIESYCKFVSEAGYEEFRIEANTSQYAFLALTPSTKDLVGGDGAITKTESSNNVVYQKAGFGSVTIDRLNPSPSDPDFFKASFSLSIASPWQNVSGMYCYQVQDQFTAPEAPTFALVSAGVLQNTLTWSPSAGATSYNIYWKTSPGVRLSDAKIAGVSSPYSHTGLTPGATYYYVITAVGPTGESYVSQEVSERPLTSSVAWAQEAYVKASNAMEGDQFGTVAMSGDTMVVGVQNESSDHTTVTNGPTVPAGGTATGSGAAYVYRRNGTQWVQEAYLKASNANAGDFFGYTVAIDGDTIAVGAIHEDSNQTTISHGTAASSDNSAAAAGAVYIFKRTGSTWVQEAYIKAPNAEGDDQFGNSVSIDRDTLVVTAPQEDGSQTTVTNGATISSNNGKLGSGAAYVFRRTGSTWAHEAYLKASNSDAWDAFGSGAKISGDTIVVGALNEDSNQTTITNGATSSSNNVATDAGAAYVFRRTGTQWAQEAYLKAANAELGDTYGGHKIAIHNDTIVIGTGHEDSNQTTITNGPSANSNNTVSNSGAVYVYKRTGTNWAQEAYIKASNAEANDQFGVSVAISYDTIVVGAHQESSNQNFITNGSTASSNNLSTNSGAAYVYKRTGNAWAQEAYLKAPNVGFGDSFGSVGWFVGICHDTIAIGAPLEDSSQNTITNGSTASSDDTLSNSGAVYLFKR